MKKRNSMQTSNKRKRGTVKKKTVRKRRKPAEITVRRSSGRKENFDRERLASTVGRSGVPFLMARDVAKKVTRQIRIESRGRKKKTVTGGRVRRIVGEELGRRSRKVATAYRGSRPQNTLPKHRQSLPKPHVGHADTDQHGVYRADRDSVMHDKSKRRTSAR